MSIEKPCGEIPGWSMRGKARLVHAGKGPAGPCGEKPYCTMRGFPRNRVCIGSGFIRVSKNSMYELAGTGIVDEPILI